MVKWITKHKGSEQLSIVWETDIQGGIMQKSRREYVSAERTDLSKVSVCGGKSLTESKYALQ